MKNFSGSFVNGKFVHSQTQENNSNDENKTNEEIKTNDINTYSNFTVSNTISFNPPTSETINNNNNDNSKTIDDNVSTTISFNPSNSETTEINNNNINNNNNTEEQTKSEKPIINPLFNPSSQLEKSEDNQEIEYIMKIMEKLRNSNPSTFMLVLQTNKKILDLVESNAIKTFSDIKELNKIFKEVEDIDIDYLFWCAHKSIKIAALKHKNLNLIHYFIINKGYRLTNKSIYHNFVNEYIKSVNNINFLECNNEIMEKYVAILQMIINQGECDVNDNEFDPVRNTPLHYAIAYKQLQFVIVLMKFKKTDLSKINANGDTPMDFAVENLYNGVDIELNKEFCKLLIMFGAKCNSMIDKYKILFEDDDESEFKTENKKKDEKNKNENKKDFSGGNKKIIVSENVGTDDNNNNNNNVEENINIMSKNKEEEKK